MSAAPAQYLATADIEFLVIISRSIIQLLVLSGGAILCVLVAMIVLSLIGRYRP
ncbi:hypothetical protein [Bradyrhizobium ottawaense]|uniref:ABC transporter permease n=1 Tax=Bradyrhizobium ottawaense TaxID=931866 RepID=A0ABY0QH84_9BRAD|nr:hypothetical protein [Bradyrhizobium ottawaense]SDK42177.1 hypothetical protein SAMN05444163_8071 [Bradyrhizobium ottawaense]